MTERFLYLSLLPEALIYSQLPPERFGMYLAVGEKRKNQRPAIFFEVEEAAAESHFDLEQGRVRCVPHADGRPRHSTYLSVYGVLEKLPVAGLKRVHLTTHSGFTIGLDPAEYAPAGEQPPLRLYQELCPVNPSAASRLDPVAFAKAVTDPKEPISVPRIAFAELELGGLAWDPVRSPEAPPYRDLPQLRDCLTSLLETKHKATKIAYRDIFLDLMFLLVRSGIFVADQSNFRFYPMPENETLERDHYLWWHSAHSLRQY